MKRLTKKENPESKIIRDNERLRKENAEWRRDEKEIEKIWHYDKLG